MVITTLKGGLGNQMFQYAAARRISYLNNVDLKFDVSFFDLKGTANVQRQYELNIFNIIGKKATVWDRWFKPRKVFVENSAGEFESQILSIKDNVCLDGFCQSEKYFKDVENIIRKEFTFRNDWLRENRHFVREIEGSNAVFLHIRLEDYLTKFKDIYCQPDPKYYDRAVKMICKRVSSPKIFVFVDDREWFEKNIPLDYPLNFVVSDTSARDWEDYLRLMTLCKHGIIANSTFSWWGAWLINNPEKIVVAPKRWFKDSRFSSKDRIPSNWFKI